MPRFAKGANSSTITRFSCRKTISQGTGLFRRGIQSVNGSQCTFVLSRAVAVSIQLTDTHWVNARSKFGIQECISRGSMKKLSMLTVALLLGGAAFAMPLGT